MAIRSYTQPVQPLHFAKKKVDLYRSSNPIMFRHWRLIMVAPLFALLFGAVIGNVSLVEPGMVTAAAGVVLLLALLLLVVQLGSVRGFIQQLRARWAAK